MDFHHFETGFEGPPGGRYKGFGDGVKFIYGQLLGQRVIVGKANGAGSYRGPAACHGGYLALMWTPGAIRTCLASGMRQLNARPAALAMNERDDSGEFRDVLILPDAEVLRGDAPMGRHCGGFGKDQSRTCPPRAFARWTKCQSLAKPSSLEYWHMGETTTRFGSLRLRRVSSSKSFGIQYKDAPFSAFDSFCATLGSCFRASL